MTVEMRPTVDLVEVLTAAAVEAIANERQGLEYEPNRVKGLHIELEVANGGAVIDGRAWIEHKSKPRRS